MYEIIFILIILYGAYVIKKSCNEKRETGLDFLLSSEDEVSGTTETSVAVQQSVPVTAVVEPVAEPEAVAEAEPEPVVEALSDGKKIPSGNLRNPETNEQVKMANSYRMSKRWVKEALVAEGLLDKIYKATEIDDGKKIEINLAFEQLLQLDKYK